MTTISINGTEYKLKYGYNSFCDSDLMDRTTEVMGFISSNDKTSTKDNDYTKKLFILVRDLVFEGFKKYNPKTKDEIGDLLDDYFDEGTEEDSHGLLDVFAIITKELIASGFIGDLLTKSQKAIENMTKKVEKKKTTQN